MLIYDSGQRRQRRLPLKKAGQRRLRYDRLTGVCLHATEKRVGFPLPISLPSVGSDVNFLSASGSVSRRRDID